MLEPTGFSASVRRDVAGIVVVEFSGELDIFVSTQLREALTPFLDGDTPVCADLGAVPFIDTTALAILLRIRRQLRDRGVAFALAGVAPVVATALDQAGLGAHLRRYPTPEDAARDLARVGE